ncbi:LOW QUALITY PROTEIN: hypothetical protein CFOL_v3_31857, partial [Cephalotus follicularis]
IKVAYSRQGIALSQRKYTLDILGDTSLMGAKPVDTPMDPNVKLDNEKRDLMHEPAKYRRLVGKLNYLTMTTLDISFAVGVVSQFMNAPRTPHWDVVLWIVKYLKYAPDHVIDGDKKGVLQMVGYSDADWAGCPMDRGYIFGYCVFVGGNLVSRSSAEAEYHAMAHVVSELTWVMMLLVEIGVTASQTASLHCDNQFAIHITANPVFHERTKQIKDDYHFIREKVKCGEIVLHHTGSEDQIADLFIKSPRGNRVTYLCNKLRLYDIYA